MSQLIQADQILYLPMLQKLVESGVPTSAGLLVLYKILQESKKKTTYEAFSLIKKSLDDNDKIVPSGKNCRINTQKEKHMSNFFIENINNIYYFTLNTTDMIKFLNATFLKIDELTLYVKKYGTVEMDKRWKMVHNLYNLENYFKPVTHRLEYPIEEVTDEKNQVKCKL